jgi:hypothetical protein
VISALLTEAAARQAPASHTDAALRTRRGRRTLVILALICALPVLASYLTYYFWQPDGRVNYGELIPPAAMPDTPLSGIAGQPEFPRRELDGRWTLVFAGPGECDPVCQQALYLMRQSRLAQGQEMERVARLWLVGAGTDPAPELLVQHDGLRVARANAAWLQQLPDAAAGRHVYLVDPLGNVMMRFPESADPRRVIKDLQRLLKYSPLGR